MPVKTIIQQRGDTAANWTSTNPILADREIGWETDTKKAKLGDGTTAWTSLTYSVVPFTAPTEIASGIVTTSVNDKSANYSIVAADANEFIRSMDTAITITIDNVLTVGQSINFVQHGTGQITFAAGTGVTLYSADSLLKTAKQYAGVSVFCGAAGIYYLVGNLG